MMEREAVLYGFPRFRLLVKLTLGVATIEL
jgi:hypothetical protein